MRTLLPSLLLALASQAVAGEPILVPDFTPASTSEFGLAFMLQDKVIEVLDAEGHVILTSDMVRPVVGDAIDSCADVLACPAGPMTMLPARVALVVRVGRESGQLTGDVSVYQKGDPDPVLTLEEPIEGGRESAFAEQVAAAIADMLSLLGPTPAEDVMAAVELVNASQQPTPPPVPDPDPLPPPVEPPPEPPPPVSPPVSRQDMSLRELLEGTELGPRHVAGSVDHLRKSDLDPRDWLYRAMPHAGRVTVEVRGGLGIGDVDRKADVRVDRDTDKTWFQEGPTASQRVRGALFTGYAPTTYMDIGLLFGLQYGVKTLTSGWERGDEPEHVSNPSTVQAVQFTLQPRLRFYLVPTGIAKPFVFAGAEFRIFDEFKIIDPAGIGYPTPPGGVVPGVVGGGGLMIDPGPIVGFFAEAAYSRYFGTRSVAAEKGRRPDTAPRAPKGTQQLFAITGGVQFRL